MKDEAVVTEVLRRCNSEALELVDIHQKLPGLKGRRGLTSWPVLQLKQDVLDNHKLNQDIANQ
jgi:hypothetical protein